VLIDAVAVADNGGERGAARVCVLVDAATRCSSQTPLRQGGQHSSSLLFG
jgi:hypothetical protein